MDLCSLQFSAIKMFGLSDRDFLNPGNDEWDLIRSPISVKCVKKGVP